MWFVIKLILWLILIKGARKYRALAASFRWAEWTWKVLWFSVVALWVCECLVIKAFISRHVCICLFTCLVLREFFKRSIRFDNLSFQCLLKVFGISMNCIWAAFGSLFTPLWFSAGSLALIPPLSPLGSLFFFCVH